jgi:hypothetical protein
MQDLLYKKVSSILGNMPLLYNAYSLKERTFLTTQEPSFNLIDENSHHRLLDLLSSIQHSFQKLYKY